MMEAVQKEKLVDNNLYQQTYEFIPWEKLHKKSILITGATGLIGQAMVRVLLFANERMQLNLKVLALVRSQEKAEYIFKAQDGSNVIKYIGGGVEQLPEIEEDIDYIIHGANPTSSRYFIDHR